MGILSFYNEDKKILETQLTGDITVDNVFSFIDNMIALSIKNNNYLWLIDYTNARYRLGTFDIYNLPKTVYSKLEKLGCKKDDVKRAIVCVNDKEDFAYLYSVAAKHKQNLKIFNTRIDAIAWLKKDE